LLSCCVLHIAIQHKRNLWRRNLKNTKETVVRRTPRKLLCVGVASRCWWLSILLRRPLSMGTVSWAIERQVYNAWSRWAVCFSFCNHVCFFPWQSWEQEKNKPIEYLSRRAFWAGQIAVFAIHLRVT
jgi:hypothetical protein